jgi:hypothetical protein
LHAAMHIGSTAEHRDGAARPIGEVFASAINVC